MALTTLEQACNAAWRRARERCWACQEEHAAGYFPDEDHTCYDDIEAVKGVALAALEKAGIAANERQWGNSVLLELEALLGGKP